MNNNMEEQNQPSKIIAYADGNLLDIEKVKAALMLYWDLGIAEKRSFDKLCDRVDLKEKYKKSKQ